MADKPQQNLPAKLIEGTENKEEFINRFNAFKEVAEKIRKIFDTKVYINRVTKKSDFDSPNWQYQRAWQDGRIEGIREVLKYLP